MNDGQNQESKYHLFSVLVHSGLTATSGHYYAYIRSNIDGQWYKFNDETVTLATEEDVFINNFGGTYMDARLNEEIELVTKEENNANSAYMLVYVR